MKKMMLMAVCVALFTINGFAHQAFTLVSSEKKTITAEQLAVVEKSRTSGTLAGANLTFTTKEIRLVIVTGPGEDMLSYRIQGLRNPTLVVPAGATLKILFVNSDV